MRRIARPVATCPLALLVRLRGGGGWGGGCLWRDRMGDVRLDLEIRVEQRFPRLCPALAGRSTCLLERQVHRRDDALERADARHELSYAMVRSDDGELVAVRIERITVRHALRRNARELETDVTRGLR